MEDTLANAARMFLPACSLYLVDLLGILLAVLWWRRHPKVSLLVCSALLLHLLTVLATNTWYLFAHRVMYESWHWTPVQVMWGYTIAAVVHCLLGAICMGLLVAAAFCARPAAKPDNPRA